MRFISNVLVGDMTLERERDFILSDYSYFSKVWKSSTVSVKSVVEIVSIAVVFLKIRPAVHLSS